MPFGDLPSGEVFYFDADNLPDGGPDAIRHVLFSHEGEVKSFPRIIEEKLTASTLGIQNRSDGRPAPSPNRYPKASMNRRHSTPTYSLE